MIKKAFHYFNFLLLIIGLGFVVKNQIDLYNTSIPVLIEFAEGDYREFLKKQDLYLEESLLTEDSFKSAIFNISRKYGLENQEVYLTNVKNLIYFIIFLFVLCCFGWIFFSENQGEDQRWRALFKAPLLLNLVVVVFLSHQDTIKSQKLFIPLQSKVQGQCHKLNLPEFLIHKKPEDNLSKFVWETKQIAVRSEGEL